MLTADELERYERQIMIAGFGVEGQEKLKRAKALIVGTGGLGSPVAIYLAAAGVGTIRIIDHDKVESSNLNRQVLHWDENIGMRKVDSAADKLQKLNPWVKIEAVTETVNEANVSQLTADVDLIVDALDNLPTRYLLNKAAIDKNIPFFHGAVYGFEGRAMTIIPGETACLKCIYQDAVTPQEKFPVIGVTPAVIGCIQATEVIKYVAGLGKPLTNILLNYDALEMKFTEFKVKRDPKCAHCGHLASKG